MRKDRTPLQVKPRDNHYLLQTGATGINRHAPGLYVCACGESFTGINKFESHRAEARKSDDAAK